MKKGGNNCVLFRKQMQNSRDTSEKKNPIFQRKKGKTTTFCFSNFKLFFYREIKFQIREIRSLSPNSFKQPSSFFPLFPVTVVKFLLSPLLPSQVPYVQIRPIFRQKKVGTPGPLKYEKACLFYRNGVKITLIMYSFLVILQPRALYAARPPVQTRENPFTDLRRLHTCVTRLSFILDTAMFKSFHFAHLFIYYHTYFLKKLFS